MADPSTVMRRLEGRVAVVTGGASGIGAATAHRLAVEGASVAVADIDVEGAAAVVEAIERDGGPALAIEVDVSVEEQVASMVAATVERYGRLDVLHANAAAVGATALPGDHDLLELDMDTWDRAMAVNLRGVVLCCKHGVPHLLDGGGGSIIATSSGSALTGFTSRFAYGASKAAIITFVRYVATTYGKQGIRANVVAPGFIESPASARMDPEARRIYQQNCLTPRLGQPEDVAAAVAFLASDDAAFITGETISIDGGTLAHTPTWAQFQDAPGVRA